ncbi:DUF418 domain-containing protein [Cognatilysobacter bugurensis]|uniref:Transporter n=1 Tax=Cognatilysobacter bugurensis TaxID=543356 RepID=A0A918W5P6_9GAMM|nr:DUF418 domain-containing protein [Lysobacter bugurensis]GHA68842.1 transporter [Lysobacter bugurensis]
MGTATVLQPISRNERIEAMDVLRGFALLGIFLMNIEAMVGPLMAGVMGTDPALRGADYTVDAVIHILVQGKFYTLFSLLFGMGFAVMMQRAEQADRPFRRLYLRRTLGLLVIGLLHSILIWSGDVLVSYALISLPLLLMFRRKSVRSLPRWSTALYLLPVGLMLLFGLMGSMMQASPDAAVEFQKGIEAQAAGTAATIEAQRLAFGGSDYFAAVAQRVEDTLTMMGYLLMFGWHVLGMFVLGAWFVRGGAIARPAEFPRLFGALRWVALPVGLALMLLSWWLEPTMAADRMDMRMSVAYGLHAVANLLMCLGYAAWVMRGLQSPATGRALAWLAPAGRMALTNYLMQSVIAMLVFSGYGLGYFEQLPRAWQPVFVIVVFALQVLLSHAWLARHRHGPMEHLWRAWTYGGQARTRVETAAAP